MSAVPSPPTNLQVVAESTTSLTFSWNAPVQPAGESLYGYLLTIQSEPSFYRIYYTATSFTVLNLDPSTEYIATIQSTNDNFETFSEAAYFPPIYPGQTVPNPVTGATAQRASNTSAIISWTPPSSFIGPEIKWFVIYSVSSNPADPVRSASASYTQTSYRITDLNPLSAYTFTVYAVNTLGYSDSASTNSVRLFQPNTIPGCMVWLDASDTTTVLQTDQGTVSSWLDKSGCERNATGGGQVYTGSAIHFQNNSMTISCPALSTQTVFLVASPSTSQATKYIYAESNGSSVPSIIANYTESWVEYFNGIDRATFAQSPSQRFMVAFEYTQGQTVKAYYNSETPVFTIQQRQINTTPVSYTTIGSDTSIDAQISEIIILKGSIGDTNIQLLVAYLKQKWGF